MYWAYIVSYPCCHPAMEATLRDVHISYSQTIFLLNKQDVATTTTSSLSRRDSAKECTSV
jgi:hypothetical protein